MIGRQRIHLAVMSQRGVVRRVACGADPKRGALTVSPATVTCQGCRSSIDMADAEVRQRNAPRP